MRLNLSVARRAITLVAAALVSSILLSASPAAAAVVLNAPSNVTATPVGASELNVRWTPPAPDGRVRQGVIVFDYARGVWSGRWTCATCSSLSIDGLTAGGKYAIVVYGESAEGAQSARAGVVATLPAITCTTNRFCASLDIRRGLGALTRAGSGLLHGVGNIPSTQLAALRPRAWRIAARSAWEFGPARASGAKVTVLLSDAFAQLDGNWDGTRLIRNPWDDWDRYRAFVIDTVRWHLDNGLVPDWWEIQNEANPGYYATSSPPTRALILEQFRVAHDAIRSVLPSAVIVGPSLADVVWVRSALIDLTTFLNYAVEQNLRFDVIAWHALGGPTFADATTQPQTIADDAASIRQLLLERPSLGTPLIVANEYGSPYWRGNPGATVKYFDALERGRVYAGNLTCYPVSTDDWATSTSTCDGGMLDGLRTPAGATAADYWTYASYASMAGGRVRSETNSPWVSALATATGPTVSVLIGRAHNCNPAVQSFCPAGTLPDAPMSGDVTIAGLTPGTYQVTVERVPNVAGAVTNPMPVSSALYGSNGTLKISVGALADGDAAVVRLFRR